MDINNNDNLDEMLHDVDDDLIINNYHKFEQLFSHSERPLYVEYIKFT